jgi:hypothetical protein
MPFSRIDIEAAYLEVNGYSVQGIPVFDGRFTSAEGVSGIIGAIGSDADIGVVRIGPSQNTELEEYRRKTDHRALVVVTGGRPIIARSLSSPAENRFGCQTVLLP